MENASKALLIAGAILIAIVLITLGVLILGKGQEVAKEADMSATEISAFNAKFTQFEGDHVRGTEVKQLYREVLQHNLVNDAGKRINIAINYEKVATDGTVSIVTKVPTGDKATIAKLGKTNSDNKLPSLIGDSGRVYAVKPTYDNKTGLISSITITQKAKQ